MYEEFRKSYTVPPFVFKNYVDLTTEEATEVLKCRNDIEVRKWMTSTEEIPLENHLKYIEGLRTSERNFYWAVYQDGILQGGISLTGIADYHADSGIFLNPNLKKPGLGLLISYISIDFYFTTLGIKRLYSVVNKENKKAIRMNQLLGSSFGSSNTDFIPVELSINSWDSQRKNLEKLFHTKNNIKN